METSDFDCVDCGLDTKEAHEYYMVEADVWMDAGMLHPHADGDGMLCIGCLEARLGRILTRADFPYYPINYGMFQQSDRLKSRLV